MTLINMQQAKARLKASHHPLARQCITALKALRGASLPLPKPIAYGTYHLLTASRTLFTNCLRIFIYTPAFSGRVSAQGRGLYLYGGFPFVAGPVDIHLGHDCRISGQTTITGRSQGQQTVRLEIGSNIDIGWQTTIAVGKQVILGNNVRIAGRCFLAGYPGHPLDAKARAQGLSETANQIGDIVLQDDVWLATGVTVMAGVTIGKGTVVAAGSVVTKDLPANVLAAGVPARVIKEIVQENDER
ncbi:acyltransferase [Motilimonas pumila]|uniref:Acyltransferase n=1 Tax=Motilimonas pumila TaxID=2303987 RepID=A0A418YD60_9GAMM|nr:acyltransferase [Motilimonas pumila]RJG42468.1 acyltransferase [Motilimonas pumila]